jgi:hypothetical protein
MTKEERARERAIRNAMAVNNALTKEYLSQLSNKVLLAFVHPSERDALGQIFFPRKSYLYKNQ